MDVHIVYVRVPGLLANAALLSGGTSLIVTERDLVRDANRSAESAGICAGMPLRYARRRVPLLAVVPIEDVNAAASSARFYDVLANLSPSVEPVAPDSAFADIAGAPAGDVAQISQCLQDALPFARHHPIKPLIGFGSTKSAARACAECGLLPGDLAKAPIRWLTPQQPELSAPLIRLGVHTLGDIVALGEEMLSPLLGRAEAHRLHRVACGLDRSDPVLPLYPPTEFTAQTPADFSPIKDRQQLQAEAKRISDAASVQLTQGNRIARCLTLALRQERDAPIVISWTTPTPLTDSVGVGRAVSTLLHQVVPKSAIASVQVTLSQIERPTSFVTADLFEMEQAERRSAFDQVKALLSARYGNRAVMTLRDLLRRTPAHERRLDAARKLWRDRTS